MKNNRVYYVIFTWAGGKEKARVTCAKRADIRGVLRSHYGHTVRIREISRES